MILEIVCHRRTDRQKCTMLVSQYQYVNSVTLSKCLVSSDLKYPVVRNDEKVEFHVSYPSPTFSFSIQTFHNNDFSRY